ncbi:hypothetical protein KUTeg_021907 [Tegillarca granosa]|uniref:Uncharacterized protein n=1 Tax=Tegillarca granosa TaxID=220873 RepID=A0ABQ9EAV6_TEGGR|nr:hypothetical protein KUTeg_021907 [Tegillarca granosa]
MCSKRTKQLLGHLNFAVRVIPPGRAFVSHLYKIMCSVPGSFDLVSLNKCRTDLKMWLSFPQNWNGVLFFHEPTLSQAEDLTLFRCFKYNRFRSHFLTGGQQIPTCINKFLSMAFLNCILSSLQRYNGENFGGVKEFCLNVTIRLLLLLCARGVQRSCQL